MPKPSRNGHASANGYPRRYYPVGKLPGATHFATLRHELLRSRKLSAEAKLLAIWLENQGGAASWFSSAELAKRLGMSAARVRLAMRELCDARLVTLLSPAEYHRWRRDRTEGSVLIPPPPRGQDIRRVTLARARLLIPP